MNVDHTSELAHDPEDLARLFVARANAGDAEGLAALYERDAVFVGRMDSSLLEPKRFNTFMPNYLLTGPDLSQENDVRQYVTATWRLPLQGW